MPLIRSGIRFLRNNLLLNTLAAMLLATGMLASSLTIAALLSFSKPAAPGTQNRDYVTIAEETHGGLLRPIAWKEFLKVRDTLERQGLVVSAYSESTPIRFETNDERGSANVSAASRDFFELFVNRLHAGNPGLGNEGSCLNEQPIIVSAEFARTRFGALSSAIHQLVRLRGTTFRVTGVAAPLFRGLFDSQDDLWIPARCVGPVFLGNEADLEIMTVQTGGIFNKPDIWEDYPIFRTVVTSHHKIGLSSLLKKSNIALHSGYLRDLTMGASPGLTVDPARDQRTQNRAALYTLLSLVLTLASTLTVAGLFIVRIPNRMAEISLRHALGGSFVRLFAELCIGPILVVLFGFIAGAGMFTLAMAEATRQLRTFIALSKLSSSWILQGILCEFVLALAICLIVAAIPAYRALGASGAPRLSYSMTSAARTMRTVHVFAVVQLAFSMAVMVVAAMTVSASRQLFQSDLGFRAEHRDSFAIDQMKTGPSVMFYNENASFPLVNAASSVKNRLAHLTYTKNVAFALRSPLELSDLSLRIQAADMRTAQSVAFDAVSQEYFDCMGMKFVAGRTYSSDSFTGVPHEAVVNQQLAESLWPGHSALGRTVNVTLPATGQTLKVAITGVIGDARTEGPRSSPQPTVYLPFRGTALAGILPWHVIVDTRESISAIEQLVDQEVAGQLPGMGSVHRCSLRDRLADLTRSEEQQQIITMAGSMVVFAIALLGIYGALMYLIEIKRREFAIRMSCGATAGKIAAIVIGKALQCAGAAAAVSVLLWPVLRDLLASTVSKTAWSSTLAIVMTGFGIAVAILVSLIPALTASRTLIWVTLRHDCVSASNHASL